jgi:hypothetical protein
MDWFAPVSSVSQWSMPRIGFGAVADSSGTLTPKLYQLPESDTSTALVRSDPFLDAVLGRTATGAGTIPPPGSAAEASGVLPSKADWLTWAADSVRDRLDLSAGFKLAAWKAETGSMAALLGTSEATAPTYFPTVSSAYRDALAAGTAGLLSSWASGNAVSEVYTRLMRGKAAPPLFSVFA